MSNYFKLVAAYLVTVNKKPKTEATIGFKLTWSNLGLFKVCLFIYLHQGDNNDP